MGYRSDVCFAVTKEALAIKLLTGERIPEALTDTWVTINVTDIATYYSFDSIKWYPGYKDIDEIIAWLQNIEPLTVDVHNDGTNVYEEEQFGFLRIGEEDDDVERMGDPERYDLYQIRSIHVPFDR